MPSSSSSVPLARRRRQQRATAYYFLSGFLLGLLCLLPCLLLVSASSSSSSSSSSPTAPSGSKVPLAPAVTGWFQSAASRKHHKEQQRVVAAGAGSNALTTTTGGEGEGRNKVKATVRLFTQTLGNSLSPLLRSALTHLQACLRVLAWVVETVVVKGPGMAVGRVGQAMDSILSMVDVETRDAEGVRAYRFPKVGGWVDGWVGGWVGEDCCLSSG